MITFNRNFIFFFSESNYNFKNIYIILENIYYIRKYILASKINIVFKNDNIFDIWIGKKPISFVLGYLTD